MTVLKQIAVVLLGLVLAAVMVTLGIWQLSVYNAQGREQAEQRAAAPPVALETVARPGQEVGDAYGRAVRFTGRYDTSFQTFIAIPDRPGHYRVLTAFRLSGGGAVPVVRGIVAGKRAPAPPSGTLTQTGVLLPPEGSDRQAAPSAQPSTVALAALAQQWDVQLVNGYATLSAPESRAQSLAPAAAALPSSHGRLRNGFYALQWWVFAGFAVLMAVRMARDLGRNADAPGDNESGGAGELAADDITPSDVTGDQTRSDRATDTSIDADDAQPGPDRHSSDLPAPAEGPLGSDRPRTDGPDAGAVPSPT